MAEFSSLPPEPLSAVDHAWLRMDEPSNLMMISGVLVFDGPVDFELIKKVMARRLLPVKRFRQRVSGLTEGRPRWQDAGEIDLDAHLERLALPEPGGDVELRALVSELISKPLDPSRPLWCFHVIDNYRGGSALMGRIHHAIGDGIALMLVLLSLADRSPELALAAVEEEHGAKLNPFTALFSHSRHALAEVRAAAEEIMPEGMKLMLKPAEMMAAVNPFSRGVGSLDALLRLTLRPSDPKTAFKGVLGVPKRAAWSESITVEDVRRLVAGFGGTVNDVLLTAMAGGLRRYLERSDRVSPKLNFRAAVPVNLRALDKMADLGNHFGLVFLSLPVGIVDPAARLAELKRRMAALKRSAEPWMAFRILQGLGVVPRALQRLVVSIIATKATAVMTNVPGPVAPLYMAGRQIRDIFFWVPQAGRVGLGISILSYAGRVRLGVGTDAGLVPDPEVIVDSFTAELELMMSQVS